MVHVKWCVRCDNTKWGEQVAVLGTFNQWDKRTFVILKTSADSFPLWQGSSECPTTSSGQIEYKYVIEKNGAILRWEPESKVNRILTVATHPEAHDVSTNDTYGCISPSRSTAAKTTVATPTTMENKFLNGNGNSNGHFRHEPPNYSNNSKNNTLDIAQIQNIYSLNEMQASLVQMTNTQKSWRQRLHFVRVLLCDRKWTSQVHSEDGMTTLHVYLSFLSTGQVLCGEDGGHHRPNHHAHEARLIDRRVTTFLTPPSASYTAHMVRGILPHLPSYASAFTVSVPLTRIRDIAHRGDIPHDLKQEIKHTLQNKLHRCAGPEDLHTSARLLERVSHGGYSPAFVSEFQRFHEELKAFFNMSSLDTRLAELPHNTGMRLLQMKRDGCPTLDQLHELVEVRARIARLDFMLAETKNVDKGEEENLPDERVQKTRLTDIDLESYAFVLFAALAQDLESPHRLETFGSAANFPFCDACVALSLALRCASQSNVQTVECDAAAHELAAVAPLFKKRQRDVLLRASAAVERVTRFTRGFADALLRSYGAVASKLGDALDVEQRATRVLPEAQVRASVAFQTSRVAGATQRALRKRLGIGAWDVVNVNVNGEVCADAVRYVRTLGHEVKATGKERAEKIVVVCEETQGDEDIPGHVVGVVSARGIPHLSHLALRARQAGVTVVCTEERAEFDKIWERRWRGGARLRARSAQGEVELEKWDGVGKTGADVGISFQGWGSTWYESEGDSEIESGVDDDKDVADIRKASLKDISTKAFNAGRLLGLAEAKGAGVFKAACGIAIPHNVFQCEIRRHREKYLRLIRAFDESGSESAADAVSSFIRDNFCPSPATLSAISDYFSSSSEANDAKVRVMVRSSANAEDLAWLSGAGLYDTVSDVAPDSHAELAEAIQQVWSSVWTRRAATSRRQYGIEHASVSMAVLVQQMVRADIAFVAMSHDPVDADIEREHRYVEMCVGMGETLASATQHGQPYRLKVGRESGAVEDLAYASYSQAIVPGSSGMRVVDYSDQRLTCDKELRTSVAKRISKGVAVLEKEFGSAQDVEGCVAFGKEHSDFEVYVVQTRPQILNSI